MKSDTAHLQKLTDEQVSARLAAYGDDGRFEQAMHALWEAAGDLIADAGRRNAEDQDVALDEEQFTKPFDAQWVHRVAQRGAGMYQAKESFPQFMAARSKMASEIIEAIEARFSDRPEERVSAISTLVRVMNVSNDVVVAQLALLEANQAADARGKQSEEFERQVAELVRGSTDQSRSLTERTRATAASARGMLGKTSEVAAAAEQSAVAMREAAQTAAGLIMAIEEARSEVEVAAGVATRASEQSARAVDVSKALSAQVEAIESILGLIRDIAGQTNLLALNATIEAARAGDAGRGFAGVAQEVKSLASQTARAPDDITAKISAIQSTVEEVQVSADRIRKAMEMQAQTVTMITAAVDETALAADSMSSTIAAIRHDTENVASEIDSVEQSFGEVDEQMARFKVSAGRFVQSFAA